MNREIEARYKLESDAYSQIREAVMSQVVRWGYYSEEAWDWRPHYNVQLFKRPTTEAKANFAYGLDSSGRIVVIHSEIILCRKVKSPPIEAFLRYHENRIEVSEVDELKLRLVEDVTLQEGHTVRIEHFDNNGAYYRDEYDWSGSNLAKHQFVFGNEKTFTERIYDPSGKKIAAEFRVRPDGTRIPLNQPLPKGVTVKSLSEKIRTRLTRGVFDVASKAGISEPIYCIALAYDGEGNGVFPPVIGIGLERERKQWIKLHGKEAKSFVWNPAEFFHYEKNHTQIEDAEYEQACEWYSQAMSLRDSDSPAKKLVNQVTEELSKLDWGKVFTITDDFVVFAVDFEGGDLRKNLKKSVPDAVIKKLKAKHLL